MSTREDIIAIEDRIIDGNGRIREVIDLDVAEACDAFLLECSTRGGGRPYPQNRNHWGTVWANAANAVRNGHVQLKPLVDILAREFDRA